MIETLKRLRQNAIFWGALGVFAMIFIGLTAASLRGTFLEDYTVQFRLVGVVGMVACFIIGLLVVAVEPLTRFSRYLGRGIRTSTRFLLENLLVASVLLSILLLLLLGRLLSDVAMPAIAAGLALANVGMMIGILRIFGPHYAPGPSVFFDSFDNGLSQWRFLCKPSAARIIYAVQGRVYCLQMPRYTRGKPEIIYVADVDDFRNGVIECDIYLLANTLINILFRADVSADRYYGARFDTRPQDPTGLRLFDKFLRRDGLQIWGHEAPDQGTRTTPERWHHLKVVLAEDTMELFKNEEFVTSWRDATYHSGQVGIMAELGVVCIDNFRITRLPSPLRIGQF